jgi:hypothetical protein
MDQKVLSRIVTYHSTADGVLCFVLQHRVGECLSLAVDQLIVDLIDAPAAVTDDEQMSLGHRQPARLVPVATR